MSSDPESTETSTEVSGTSPPSVPVSGCVETSGGDPVSVPVSSSASIAASDAGAPASTSRPASRAAAPSGPASVVAPPVPAAPPPVPPVPPFPAVPPDPPAPPRPALPAVPARPAVPDTAESPESSPPQPTPMEASITQTKANERKNRGLGRRIYSPLDPKVSFSRTADWLSSQAGCRKFRNAPRAAPQSLLLWKPQRPFRAAPRIPRR